MTDIAFCTREVPEHVAALLRSRGVELRTHHGPRPMTPEDLQVVGEEVDAVITTLSERLDRTFFTRPGLRVRVVSNIATGTDNIDLAAAAEAGVSVCRVPARVTSAATAELAVTLMLMAARQPRAAEDDLRAGRWERWEPQRWTGLELSGSTLGLVGFGSIGERVGRVAHALGMQVLFTRRSTAPAPPWARAVDLTELVSRSHVLSVHVPLTPATRGLVGAAELAALPRGAVVVNTARGGIVDEAALLSALRDGQVGGAGLDVFATEPVDLSDPLLQHPRVVATPHIGSATVATRRAMVESAVESCLAALSGRPLSPEVAAPTVGTTVVTAEEPR